MRFFYTVYIKDRRVKISFQRFLSLEIYNSAPEWKLIFEKGIWLFKDFKFMFNWYIKIIIGGGGAPFVLIINVL